MKSSLNDMIKIIKFAKKLNFGLIFQPVGTGVEPSQVLNGSLRDRYFGENMYFYDNIPTKDVFKKVQ